MNQVDAHRTANLLLALLGLSLPDGLCVTDESLPASGGTKGDLPLEPAALPSFSAS